MTIKENENFHLTSFLSLSIWFTNFGIKCERSGRRRDEKINLEQIDEGNWKKLLRRENLESDVMSFSKISMELWRKFNVERQSYQNSTNSRKENNNHISPSIQDPSSSASLHSETWKFFFQFNISPKNLIFFFFHVFLRLSYHKLFAIDVWWSKILGAIFRLQRCGCDVKTFNRK